MRERRGSESGGERIERVREKGGLLDSGETPEGRGRKEREDAEEREWGRREKKEKKEE